MRNEVVRLRKRASTQRGQLWHGTAAPGPVDNVASSVVVLFPERSRIARGNRPSASTSAEAARRLARMEQENAELRRRVVDLALQVQALKEDAGRPELFVASD